MIFKAILNILCVHGFVKQGDGLTEEQIKQSGLIKDLHFIEEKQEVKQTAKDKA